jgi:hypothetical protein
MRRRGIEKELRCTYEVIISIVVSLRLCVIAFPSASLRLCAPALSLSLVRS